MKSDSGSNLSLEMEQLLNAVGDIYQLVLLCNLTKNTYQVHAYQTCTIKEPFESGTIDELIAAWFATVPDADRENLKNNFSKTVLLAAYRAGEKKAVQMYRQINDDGSIHWINITAVFFTARDTGDIMALTFVQDIDEEIKKKEAEQYDLLCNIIDSSTTAILVLDITDDTVLYANKQMLRFMGKKSADYTGKKCYDYICRCNCPCFHCVKLDRLEENDNPHEMYIASLDRYFSVRVHPLTWRGKPAIIEYVEDISAQKRSQNEIFSAHDELKRRFENAAAHVNIKFVTFDIQHNILYQDEKEPALPGFPVEIPDPGNAIPAGNLLNESDSGAFREFFEKVVSGEQVSFIEFRQKKDGGNSLSEYWVRLYFTVFKDYWGEPVSAWGTVQDISSERFIKQCYEFEMNHSDPALLDSICVNVSKDRVVQIRHSDIDVEMPDNLPVSFIAEKFVPGITDPVVAEKFKALFTQAGLMAAYEADNAISLEYRAIWENDSILWVRADVHFLRQLYTNDIIAFVHISDIDDQKMMQEIIEATVQYDYKSLAIINLSDDSIKKYSNKKDSMNIVSTGKFSEQIAQDLQFVHPDDRWMFSCNVTKNKILMELELNQTFDFSYRVIDRGGDPRVYRSRFAVYDKGQGQILYTTNDITDVISEQKRQQSFLSDALFIARQANEAKNKFLSSMSHDIRTPMNAIIGMTEIALSDESNAEQVHESLNVIKSSSLHLLSIINDILDMSRIESGKMVFVEEPFSHREETEKMRKIWEAILKEKKQTFNCSLNVVHDYCIGDTVRIYRILDNIVSNAIKFTPAGGHISLEITEHKARSENMRLFRFVVADNGIGMSNEQIMHIFEPFYRTPEVQEKRIDGTGLGLAIVKGMVDISSGTIAVKSQPNRGTTVTVELPLRIADSCNSRDRNARGGRAEIADLKGLHILLVEDHKINQLVARRLLEKCGMIVTLAENGQQAYDCFIGSKQGEYDAILMDIQMPVMNGYEATVSMRESKHPDATSIPIIAMSANALAGDVRKCFEAGMNAHIVKPVEMLKLYNVLFEQVVAKKTDV